MRAFQWRFEPLKDLESAFWGCQGAENSRARPAIARAHINSTGHSACVPVTRRSQPPPPPRRADAHDGQGSSLNSITIGVNGGDVAAHPDAVRV